MSSERSISDQNQIRPKFESSLNRKLHPSSKKMKNAMPNLKIFSLFINTQSSKPIFSKNMLSSSSKHSINPKSSLPSDDVPSSESSLSSVAKRCTKLSLSKQMLPSSSQHSVNSKSSLFSNVIPSSISSNMNSDSPDDLKLESKPVSIFSSTVLSTSNQDSTSSSSSLSSDSPRKSVSESTPESILISSSKFDTEFMSSSKPDTTTSTSSDYFDEILEDCLLDLDGRPYNIVGDCYKSCPFQKFLVVSVIDSENVNCCCEL